MSWCIIKKKILDEILQKFFGSQNTDLFNFKFRDNGAVPKYKLQTESS